MSTRCSIGYEDDDGNYVGVYCHYDGYPKAMFPALDCRTYEEVKEIVETALYEGGLRTFDDAEFITFQEPCQREQWLFKSVFAHENKVDYTYMKRKDGSIFATSCSGREIENPY